MSDDAALDALERVYQDARQQAYRDGWAERNPRSAYEMHRAGLRKVAEAVRAEERAATAAEAASTLDAERGARRAAEADASRSREALSRVRSVAQHAQDVPDCPDAADHWLMVETFTTEQIESTPPPGIARGQAVAEAARAAVRADKTVRTCAQVELAYKCLERDGAMNALADALREAGLLP